MFPLISEYIEAIKSAEDSFKELTYLRPLFDDDGQPVMTSGNFAVVFKMQDVKAGKFYALKCFTKEQEGRTEAYHQIADALKDVNSTYLVSFRYLDKELFVDTKQTAESEFPVLLMDWVEGKTLDKYLRENLNDKRALELLAFRFGYMAQWFIPQPFAHGDLKPDNILVREDGTHTLVLVDYDGMYVPAMKGQKARELGSPDFRHPLRTENDFDEHIDDFPFMSILFSLNAIALQPNLLEKYGATDRLLLSAEDYRQISECRLFKEVIPSEDSTLNSVFCSFMLLYNCSANLSVNSSRFTIGWGVPEKRGIGIASKIYKSKSFGKNKPYACVHFKKTPNDNQVYYITYDLRLIYAKECIKDNGEFDCEAAYDLFTKEMYIGYCESIYLFDIYVGEVIDCQTVMETKTCREITVIPIATYGDRNSAVHVARNILDNKIMNGSWRFV